MNNVFYTIETQLNGFVAMLNTAIGIINKIPNVNIGKVSQFKLPRLARGGIVDGATPLIAGEDGKEAIVPLEHNTEWMDVIGSKIQGGSSDEEVQLMREQNVLLREILDKDTGITERAIFKATQNQAHKYKQTTGKPAFV